MGHYYSISLHGIKFNRMYLYDYSISVEPNQKTLAVTLKDYSLMLNKVYVGLMKRQGPHRFPGEDVCDPRSASKQLIRQTTAEARMTTLCPNCYLAGSNNLGRGKYDPATTVGYGKNLSGFFTKMRGSIYRDCSLGSFIGRVDPTDTDRYGIF